MQKTDDAGTVTVPVPMHDELKRGTLRSIIRQSGIDGCGGRRPRKPLAFPAGDQGEKGHG